MQLQQEGEVVAVDISIVAVLAIKEEDVAEALVDVPSVEEVVGVVHRIVGAVEESEVIRLLIMETLDPIIKAATVLHSVPEGEGAIMEAEEARDTGV